MVNPIYADLGILFRFHPCGNRSSEWTMATTGAKANLERRRGRYEIWGRTNRENSAHESVSESPRAPSCLHRRRCYFVAGRLRGSGELADISGPPALIEAVKAARAANNGSISIEDARQAGRGTGGDRVAPTARPSARGRRAGSSGARGPSATCRNCRGKETRPGSCTASEPG